MKFRVLGSLQIFGDDGEPANLRPGAPRTVLARLLAGGGSEVPTEALKDALWPQRPPASARRNVQLYVHELRRAVGAATVVSTARGYVLPAGEDVDAERFRRLAADGIAALDKGDLTIAGRRLRAALALWRGPAYAEFRECQPIDEEAARLEQLKASAENAMARTELATGRHAEVLPMLADLADARPFDESLCALLMVALYRCGRQAEALEVFRKARSRLSDELGIEPGPQLQAVHAAILRGQDPELSPARTTAASFGSMRRLLPRDLPDFTGRHEELSRLDEIVATGGAVVIGGVSGTAGVGKTMLAVHWAHRMAADFPDGQLYVNLHGFDPGGPVATQSALSALLRDLGLAPDRIPAEVDPAAALYRTTTAGRRLLVVIDDARSAEHVRPLLPAGAGSVTLVTSRDSLASLVVRDGARMVMLAPMSENEALALLESILGAQRVAGERAAAAELVRLCGGLPLALRIAAAHLQVANDGSIAALNDRLRHSDRLDHLAIGEEAVEAVFDQSYRTLNPDDQRMFRLLGLHHGPDITAEAAAALASVTVDQADAILGRLNRSSLLIDDPDGRYRLHDLVKLYATRMAVRHEPEPGREQAALALLDHYLTTTVRAAAVVAPHFPILTVTPHRAPHLDAATATKWLQAERPNLVAAVLHGPPSIGWRLADALRGYYWIHQDRGEALTVLNTGMAAAVSDASVTGQAAMHLGLGTTLTALGRLEDSFSHQSQALELSRASGWREGEIAALGGLGIIHTDRGDQHTAIAHFTDAARLNEQLGRTAALAVSRSNIGALQLGLGELRAAAGNLAAALDLFQITGNRPAEAIMHCNLGLVQLDLGAYVDARKLLQQAITIHREMADRDGEAVATLGLAELGLRTDRLNHTVRHAQRAIQLAAELGSPRYHAIAQIALAHVHRLRGQLTDALELGGQALATARDIAMRFIENDALDLLAQVKNDQGRRSAAHADVRQALAIAQADGYQAMIAKALTTLAEIHLTARETHDAHDYARQALAICERTGIQQCVPRLERILGSRSAT